LAGRRAEARLLAADEGEEAAIRFVLKALGDGHSFYAAPRASGLSAVAPGEASRRGKRPPLSEPREPVRGIPVIEVRAWTGTPDQGVSAAVLLRSQVRDALSRQRCGIVLDFSRNGGGNMWPMLYGLSPLIPEGVIGYFQDAAGLTRPIEKRGSTFLVAGIPQPFGRPDDAERAIEASRIAIIVGPASASSGEIVPIMFHGQGNVRLFGRPSAGRSTANSSFPLPNGGTANITTAITLDRNRNRFGGRIVPDEASDEPLRPATQWVVSGCRRR
jgi:C-terminal processing protease CtpA/Prc